ncbi:MAG: HEAT repeat domain-containing protein [Planctomycetes bacterium]|nr:HEAT repeat domain-containing protein [Planctomycetota bacterium]
MILLQLLACATFVAPQAGPHQVSRATPSTTSAPRASSESSEDAARAADQELARELAIIVRRARDPKDSERSRLADAIARLGDRAIDPLLGLLEVRRVPAVVGDQPVQVLSVYQEQIVFEGLERIGADKALAQMDRRLAVAAEERRRLAALKVFGRLGERDRMERMFALAAPMDDEPADEQLVGGLRASLAVLLARDPLALPRLNSTWRSIDPALLEPIVFALGELRDGRGLEFATDVAFSHPELVPVVAAQIVLIGRSPDSSVNARAIEFLRETLDVSEGHLASNLARALAVLEDDGSVQRWIDFLDAESNSLRSAALWSLVHFSKLEYSPTPALWQAWWDREQAWFDAEYEPLLADLDSPDAGKATAALRALATRHVRRHEVAREITRVLSDERPALRKLACDVLRELGSIDALPELALARLDEDPAVARAAWSALGSLSGRAFELESPEWEALVAAREP